MKLILVSLLAATATFAAEPFAVVELFTSEGCSSCPPADTLLAEIAGQKNVYALAFHVDYWNYLGWTDPFSDAKFSDRQRAYAGKFRIRSIYTPQMIINGTEEFVGSDRQRAKRAIDAALKKPASVEVKLRAVAAIANRGEGNDPRSPSAATTTIEYEVTGVSPGSVLNLALVERGLVTNVKRGENAGKTLRHENVVRMFVTKPAGKGEVELPAKPNTSVIAYVQDAKTMEVLGAGIAR